LHPCSLNDGTKAEEKGNGGVGEFGLRMLGNS
jgi:hypothetical protein